MSASTAVRGGDGVQPATQGCTDGVGAHESVLYGIGDAGTDVVGCLFDETRETEWKGTMVDDSAIQGPARGQAHTQTDLEAVLCGKGG